ncbi:sugar phosphate isomerase/epimerase family protein [Paenibacillus eucommiae]|uniref:Sugar phosphate isomerase/epimerase n=1 Tax=Paenibacillus eucommiae TaxID=1355755 RepID=A0ABS4IT48_9BACL|nr:sugar phosphate isomerase/epimerase family protein [Paenibacillus eucommiae]MBP1990744.1 sugar phosphate isomerase/epimerase [Paenibacillus eucommiae]
MELGVLVALNHDVRNEMKKVRDLGLNTCQLCCFDDSFFTDEMVVLIKEASEEFSVRISHFWCGWAGPMVWDFQSGPSTLGLVPTAYRDSRMQTLVKGIEFTHKLGVSDIITHVGFIPEDPNDREYNGVLNCLQYLVQKCKERSIHFLFETGQETPVALLRMIEDLGGENVGINLDPANLVLYGKGNPVDAMDVFGKYVRGVHAKDGLYPTNPKFLGHEVQIGHGKVNFPALISRLKDFGYEGAITIEREISGDQQIADILESKKLLEALI